MTDKTKNIISTFLLVIPGLVLLGGGITKITGTEPKAAMDFLNKMGFGNKLIFLGITELLIAVLLVYPKTKKIGFLLASCYFAGAFCLELAGGQPPAAGIFLSILWIATFMRERALFV